MFGSRHSLRPWPVCPDTGMNDRSLAGLNPSLRRYGRILSLHSLYLTSDHSTVGSSILFISTTRCFTPAVFANMACSLVCPPLSNPVSNSPFLAEITWKWTFTSEAYSLVFIQLEQRLRVKFVKTREHGKIGFYILHNTILWIWYSNR